MHWFKNWINIIFHQSLVSYDFKNHSMCNLAIWFFIIFFKSLIKFKCTTKTVNLHFIFPSLGHTCTQDSQDTCLMTSIKLLIKICTCIIGIIFPHITCCRVRLSVHPPSLVSALTGTIRGRFFKIYTIGWCQQYLG